MSDVRLPPELAAALDTRLQGLSTARLTQQAADISENYRARKPSRQSIGGSGDALAYALSRLPATYAAVTDVLGRLGEAMPDFAPETLLDVGAGPGTASWAVAGRWPGLRHVTMLEHNPAFRQLATALAGEAGHPALAEAEVVAHELADGRLPGGQVDLAIVSYAMTELEDRVAGALLAGLTAAAEVVVIIEPGTPRDFARLMALRAAALAGGARIVAPCPHEAACPLLSRDGDWCHFSVRLPRRRSHMQLKGASVPFEDERYGYLVLAREAAGARNGRVLKPPRPGKAEIAFDLCRPDGSAGLLAVPVRDKAFHRRARKLGWGDGFPG